MIIFFGCASNVISFRMIVGKRRRKSLSVSFSIVRRHFFASYGKQWKAMYSKGKRMDLKTIQANASSSSPLLLFDACFQIKRSIENVYDRWYGKNAEQTPMASIKLFRKSHRLVQQQQRQYQRINEAKKMID